MIQKRCQFTARRLILLLPVSSSRHFSEEDLHKYFLEASLPFNLSGVFYRVQVTPIVDYDTFKVNLFSNNYMEFG